MAAGDWRIIQAPTVPRTHRADKFRPYLLQEQEVPGEPAPHPFPTGLGVRGLEWHSTEFR